MNTIIEVAIGLALVYLLFSLLASTINEAVLGHLAQLRSRVLRESLCVLLSDQPPNSSLVEFWHVMRLVFYRVFLFFYYPKTGWSKTNPKAPGSGGDNFAQMIMDHPLVKGLAIHGQPCPNYLPAENFADAVIGTLVETAKTAIKNKNSVDNDVNILALGYVPSRAQMPDQDCVALALNNLENFSKLDVNSIAVGMKHLSDAHAKKLLASVLAEVKDIETARQNLATWFNNSMDRVTGLYRRKTQFWLYIWATLIVFVLNVDSIEIAKKLFTDSEFRGALVARATDLVDSTNAPGDTNSLSHYSAAELQSQIQDLKLPIGWPGKDAISKITNSWMRAVITRLPVVRCDSGPTNQPNLFFSATLSGTAPYPQTPEGWWLKLLGLLITVAAVSQGAPFWFDLLNRFTNLRAAGKPPKVKDSDS